MPIISKKKLVKLWRSKWPFGVVIAVVSAVMAMILSTLPSFENIEYKTYDFRFAIRGEQETKSDKIVIVAIDDASFSGLKTTWPFSRSIFALAILNLYEAGARLVLLDIDYTDPALNPRQDTDLAGAIKTAKRVILSGKITRYSAGQSLDNHYLYATPPTEVLKNTGAPWGFVNIDEDPDGFIRRYLLFQEVQNRVYYPLSLYAYLALQSAKNGSRKILRAKDGEFIIGSKAIPKADYNSMLINFRGPTGTFPTYSLTDILDDSRYRLPNAEEDTDIFDYYKKEGLFKNKVVFIGATAKELQDNKHTPFFSYQGVRRQLPGVELHANALSTLLRGDPISTAPPLLTILAAFLLSAAAMIVTKWLKPFRGMLGVMAIILLYFVIALYFFIQQQTWMQVTMPVTAILFSYVGTVLHQTLTEQRERVRIKKSWQQFMSPDVIENMLESGDLPKFGGERRELTILFSDIRGFTTFSEKYSSHEVVKKLNEYLTEMVDAIFKNNGTLDKFVGDEIMAIYGAPHSFKEHAEKACLTALEMVDRLRVLQKDWSSKGEEFFEIGIGINSGKVILGNLGSSQLFDYTVIGDDVNLGARLEGANKQYGTTIIISESTYKAVKNKMMARELDSVRVKGKKKPVRIFELRGVGDAPEIEKDLIIETYTEGLSLYRELKWYQALTRFNRVLRYFPTDGPTRVYIQRCLDFMETPPPENWDGVYEFTTK